MARPKRQRQDKPAANRLRVRRVREPTPVKRSTRTGVGMEVKMNRDYRQEQGYGLRPMNRHGNDPANFGAGSDRGWWDRTSDEVSSWLGDDEAERRRRMDERSGGGHLRREFTGRRSGMPARYSNMNAEGSYRDRNNWRDMRAGDVMTANVATVYADDLVTYAARAMGECDCGALPVVDRQGRMIGMITDRDIAIRLVGNRVDTVHARVEECMTDEAFACNVNSPLEDCMRTMSHHKIRRVPVVDDRNRVIGIISQADIAQHASENVGTGERRAVTDVVCAVSEPTASSYI